MPHSPKRITRPSKPLLLGAMFTLVLLVAACAGYKPLRVVAPEPFGLTCVTDTLCVEDVSTVAEATALSDDALRFIAENVGSIDHLCLHLGFTPESQRVWCQKLGQNDGQRVGLTKG